MFVIGFGIRVVGKVDGTGMYSYVGRVMSRSSAKPKQWVSQELIQRALMLSECGFIGREVASRMGISKTWANLLIKRGKKITQAGSGVKTPAGGASAPSDDLRLV